ncbi:MAG: hypothetical protein ACRDTA_11040 [Pseudonocardiaceae bacterium]
MPVIFGSPCWRSGGIRTNPSEGGSTCSGHLTYRVLRSDPRKIVLVRSGVEVDSCNHRDRLHRKPDTVR